MGRNRRAPPDQHEMAAQVKRGILGSQPDRIVEGGAVGHQRSRSENAALVRFDNSLVHILRKAEVIRVDDQPFQDSPSLMRRNFFGLA